MKGTLFIISAPSGAGKTSLVKKLLADDPNLVVSVSHTTRSPRPGEIDGQAYHFVEAEAFEQLVAEHAFLEHANVFEHAYGTSKAAVENELLAGRDVILEIDWQGAQQINTLMAAVSIFILPPSKSDLEDRLKRRGQDSGEVIAKRMEGARAEMMHHHEYNFLVFNEDFEQALAQLRAIVTSTRLRTDRQTVAHRAQIEDLLAE